MDVATSAAVKKAIPALWEMAGKIGGARAMPLCPAPRAPALPPPTPVPLSRGALIGHRADICHSRVLRHVRALVSVLPRRVPASGGEGTRRGSTPKETSHDALNRHPYRPRPLEAQRLTAYATCVDRLHPQLPRQAGHTARLTDPNPHDREGAARYPAAAGRRPACGRILMRGRSGSLPSPRICESEARLRLASRNLGCCVPITPIAMASPASVRPAPTHRADAEPAPSSLPEIRTRRTLPRQTARRE